MTDIVIERIAEKIKYKMRLLEHTFVSDRETIKLFQIERKHKNMKK